MTMTPEEITNWTHLIAQVGTVLIFASFPIRYILTYELPPPRLILVAVLMLAVFQLALAPIDQMITFMVAIPVFIFSSLVLIFPR